ncbi:transmembrane protein 106B-like [Oscarella lobularis]|uniref:transmembrane protein 106B-like n=1 Tax=Oscarella lobularis TaxID=121494 RepID=UPI003313F7C9
MCASVLQVSNPDVIMSSSRRSASPPSATAKPCPTCKGTGVLNENNSDLVALIPYEDKRLKPRRTLLFVFIGVLLTLCASFLLVFFLFPRSVSVNWMDNEKKFFSVNQGNDTSKFQLGLTTGWKFKNNNFYPTKAENVEMQIEHYGQSVGKINDLNISLGISATKIVQANIILLFTEKSAVKVRAVCSLNSWQRGIDLDITLTANFHYLNEVQSILEPVNTFIECSLRND